MLILARTWIRETFEPGSRPRLADVVEWIKDGEVPGRIIAGMPYIDADRFAVAESTTATPRSGVDLLLQ